MPYFICNSTGTRTQHPLSGLLSMWLWTSVQYFCTQQYMFWARSEHGQTLVDNLRIDFSILRISALWHCSFSERLLQNNRQVSFDSNFFNPLSDCLRILFEMRVLVCLATKLVTTQNHNSCLIWHGWSVMLFCSFLSSLSCLKVSQKARVPHSPVLSLCLYWFLFSFSKARSVSSQAPGLRTVCWILL